VKMIWDARLKILRKRLSLTRSSISIKYGGQNGLQRKLTYSKYLFTFNNLVLLILINIIIVKHDVVNKVLYELIKFLFT
jgi:hypothetical protein